MNASSTIGLDFETYSAAPLPSVGLRNYVNDPTFTPTLAAVAMETGTSCFDTFDTKTVKVFEEVLRSGDVVAHNAGFERAVLLHLGIDIPVYDSAVVAAMAGADRHLAGAARQLLDIPKLDEDRSLLRLFAMPQDDQEDLHFDTSLPSKHPNKWQDFIDYCMRDAELSRNIFITWMTEFDVETFRREMRYAQLTLSMNERGWPVSINEVVRMRDMVNQNLSEILDDFARRMDPDLNLFSHDQVKKWAADRGVRSASFDKENVDRLIKRLVRKQSSKSWTKDYDDVLFMLETKRQLGGSSVKKLNTILDLTAKDGRLYDQYFHCGAAQSLRTTGRGVQMQNLPRLPIPPDDMSTLFTESWDNDKIGSNIRQVFRAKNGGLLFVGDFASIESRGLAYLAGEDWKLDQYRMNADVYKAQARKIYGLPVDADVSKDQRMTGKVGELSCGYGAGPVAVKDFAAKMHVELTEGEAKQLVWDWRDANPKITELWAELDAALKRALDMVQPASVLLHDNMSVVFHPSVTPKTLRDLDSKVQSIRMALWRDNNRILTRVFHGCYMRGTNVAYWKPSSLKGGDPWKKRYVDPKTKQTRHYELYGGKLAGILTQSLCREIFFECAENLDDRLYGHTEVQIIGQFHDELIVEWMPTSSLGEHDLIAMMEHAMSRSSILPDLPMAAEIGYARRYLK